MQIRTTTGDITNLAVDAIVNAANEHLVHGGGVAAAIARAGAPTVDQESRAWIRLHGQLGPGQTAVTGAGGMKASWVIHVVGPRYGPGQDNAGLLTEAVEACLNQARTLGARTVALPAISAGVFGYPREEATRVIAAAVIAWRDRHTDLLDQVTLVGYDEATTEDFRVGLAESA